VTDCDTAKHEKDEILDLWFFDTFAKAREHTAHTPEPGQRFDLVLVRTDASEGRTWAYMEAGRLPQQFEDAWQRPATNVPQRFHREVERAA
jgi:hypothetical protein